MLFIARYAGDAWNYLRRTTVGANQRLWSIVYFEDNHLRPVSSYYTFVSDPYVGNVMHGVAKEVLALSGFEMGPYLPGLTRKFSDVFRDEHFAGGGMEMGGHAEEQFARNFHTFYQGVIAAGARTAIILNSDSPCTLADVRPSHALTAKRPENPLVTFTYGISCTTKLNQLAGNLRDAIPRWELYYRRPFGVLTARGGSAAVLGARDRAESQLLSAQNIVIRRFHAGMESTARMYGL